MIFRCLLLCFWCSTLGFALYTPETFFEKISPTHKFCSLRIHSSIKQKLDRKIMKNYSILFFQNLTRHIFSIWNGSCTAKTAWLAWDLSGSHVILKMGLSCFKIFARPNNIIKVIDIVANPTASCRRLPHLTKVPTSIPHSLLLLYFKKSSRFFPCTIKLKML